MVQHHVVVHRERERGRIGLALALTLRAKPPVDWLRSSFGPVGLAGNLTMTSPVLAPVNSMLSEAACASVSVILLLPATDTWTRPGGEHRAIIGFLRNRVRIQR